MLSPLALRLSAAAVLMLVGAFLWTVTPIIGPAAVARHLRAEVSDLSGQLKTADAYGKNREEARRRCEAARVDERDDGAGNIAEAAQRASLSRTGAFNTGYAAGKTAGRASCQGKPANASPPAAPVAGPVVVGVRDDFAAAFAASAYKPGAALRP